MRALRALIEVVQVALIAGIAIWLAYTILGPIVWTLRGL